MQVTLSAPSARSPHATRPRCSGRLLALLVLALGVSVHVHASADAQAPLADVQPTEIPPEPPAGYRDTINAAVTEFAAGHHAEARALFRQAHGMYPNARTLRGIGMCAFELREYAEAVRALGAALHDPRRPLSAEMTAQVETALARANAFVGRYEVDVPEGALLFVDDSAAPVSLEEDGSLLLSLGTHVVTTRRGSTTLSDVRVEVRGGERERLELVTARPEVQAQTSVPDPVRVPPVEPPPPPPDFAPSIAVIATGSVLTLGGLVSFFAGLVESDRVSGAAPGTAWSSLEGSYERAPLLQGLGMAAAIAGTGMLVLGVLLLGDAEDAQERATSLGFGPGSLTLRGTF